MSGFWSTWVVVLACVTAGISLFLFVWGITMRIPTSRRRHHGPRLGAWRTARRSATASEMVGGGFRWAHFSSPRGISI